MAKAALGQDFLLGHVLGHYRIVERVGAGGMGIVYRALDEHLDNREVAIKILPQGALADEASRLRFRKEAQSLSKLNHPNIASVIDFDCCDGMDYLVEEFVAGIALNELLTTGPLPEREIVSLGTQLCEGLAAAHEHGIIHRDVKPSNTRVTPEAILKVLDFGLAKSLRAPAQSGNESVTQSETQIVAGTLPYMSPEQLRNEKLDARTDIWAAGCVLYEMATGRRPFLGQGTELIDQILHQPLAPPSKLNQGVSAGLGAIILKCMERDVSLRYGSAREIAVDLRRLASVSAAPASVPTRRAGRNHVLLAALVVVLVTIVAAFWFWRRSGRAAPTPPVRSSIAVLPFVDLSPGKDQEYFADGLAEELLNDLARIPELKVTARTSAFQFKGKNEDLRVIGAKLSVATILEGSVRKEGDRIRVTAQFIRVADGFHLWSETFDSDLKNIITVQEKIARAVAGSLKLTLRTMSQTASPEAYNAYLQGNYFARTTTKESQEKRVSYYQQAIQHDPKYALAWASLSLAHWAQASMYGYIPIEEGNRKAREEAQRALALEPNLALAHLALARVKLHHDWDWEGADASYQRALFLEPENVSVVMDEAGLALTLGRQDEARQLASRAVELDPLRPWPHYRLGFTEWYSERVAESETELRRALELDPGHPFANIALCQLYSTTARPQEALAAAERVTLPNWHLYALALANYAADRKPESDRALAEFIAMHQADAPFQIAEIYAFRGETDRTFEWLERAYLVRDSGLSMLKDDPLLKNTWHDPRYAALLKKLQLPQ